MYRRNYEVMKKTVQSNNLIKQKEVIASKYKVLQ